MRPGSRLPAGRCLGALVAGAVLAAGCTGGDAAPAPGAATVPAASATTAPPTRAPEPRPSRSAAPAPSPTPAGDPAFGTGTVTVDGTEMRVSGDCDVSREFGEQPVDALDGEVDVVLAVDNVTGDGGHDGAFALRVRLLGGGEVVGRTITSRGAPGDDGATADVAYAGTVEVAELRDRRELEYLDAAVLHLEARQQRDGGPPGPARRRLVVDVACPVSRPG